MIAIIEGCGTNISSLEAALNRLGQEVLLTKNPTEIAAASHVILPGVGTANAAMQRLRNSELIPVILELTQPVLGICLGMQLLFSHSAEGDTDCLNIIPGTINLWPRCENLILPHMGWNQLNFLEPAHPLAANILTQAYVYFVHSYQAAVGHYTLATSEYGHCFSAIVQHKNFYGMQFHPERSGAVGEQLLANFLSL